MKIQRCIYCALLIVGGAGQSLAALISVGPTTFVQSVGSFPTLLAIQNQGTASGCVGFVAGGDVIGLGACPGGFTGDAGNETGATGTLTIAQLGAAGILTPANLRFVFNSGEPNGGGVTFRDLALTFFDVDTDSTFTATFFGTPLNLPNTTAESGTHAGFAFRLDTLEAGFASDFFKNPNNRVGAAATLSGSAGGLDTFFLASSAPVSAIPEPASAFLVIPGLLGVGALVRRRWRSTWPEA